MKIVFVFLICLLVFVLSQEVPYQTLESNNDVGTSTTEEFSGDHSYGVGSAIATDHEEDQTHEEKNTKGLLEERYSEL
jgi:hypothetical protein